MQNISRIKDTKKKYIYTIIAQIIQTATQFDYSITSTAMQNIDSKLFILVAGLFLFLLLYSSADSTVLSLVGSSVPRTQTDEVMLCTNRSYKNNCTVLPVLQYNTACCTPTLLHEVPGHHTGTLLVTFDFVLDLKFDVMRGKQAILSL